MKGWFVKYWRLFLIAILMAGTGCDPAFEPLQENDRYFFSIYGYLDSSADTHWVRVMPVRDQIFTEPEPIDATVTIEDLSGQASEVMNDSLFYYGDDAWTYNFWTTMPLEPGNTYRVTAEREDGRSSFVDVHLPDDFPTPLVVDTPRESVAYDVIYIEGVENLADVRSFHHMRHLATGIESRISISHLGDTTHTEDPYDYIVAFDDDIIDETLFNLYSWDPSISSNNFYDKVHPIRQQLFIAAAGPDWHHFPMIDENIIALPDGISNVENGVGYVAGIVSKTVPYQTCYNEGDRWIPCPLEKPMMNP